MNQLLIAAGGGGDAVGAILARRLIAAHTEDPLLIATYAWERVRVDPEPGPRPPEGFSRLGVMGTRKLEVTPESDTLPPGRSTLPRLAQDTGARLFVLDANGGAVGMRQEISLLVGELDVERIVLVDVGGDAVARGTESALLSPLADALALAATTGLNVPVDVSIIGPGVDGELPEDVVLSYLAQLDAIRAGVVTGMDVDALAPVFRWHPTEATGLVAAAADGIRGPVELRRGSISTSLTDHSAEVWLSNINAVSQHNCLVLPLADTTSLDEAERTLGRWATSELIRERQRALALQDSREQADVATSQLLADVSTYSRSAAQRNVELITSRRLAEATGHPELEISRINEVLRSHCPSAQRGPLWHIPSLAIMTA